MRARSASLQKGVAVLKALARAPEDPDYESEDEVERRNGHKIERDSGYADDVGEADVGRVPGLTNGAAMTDKEEEEKDREARLSEEAKQSGRANREGLRQRGEQRQVERLVGKRAKSSNTSITTLSDNKRPSATKRRSSQHSSVKSWEIPRKIFHSSIGFLVLYLYLSHTNLSIIVRNLAIFLGVVITADVLRLNIPWFEGVYESVLGFLMREAEKEKVNGVVWYLVGVITCLHFYPADIACVSIMILSWADTSASVFGRLYGSRTPPLPSPPFATRKSTAGFSAAIVAGTLTAAVFWASPIASIGMRAEGLSIAHDPSASVRYAVLGTSAAPGATGTGWSGWQWGFRPSAPEHFLAYARPAGRLGELVKKTFAHGTSSGIMALPLPLLCLASGIVAGVAEGLELGGVDDNLSLPILSAMGIHATLVSWGWFASAFL